MEAPFLSTKLFIPPARPGLVARPRLMERLSEALIGSLVILSAPAGSGKTTVVVQWISLKQPPGGVAWVSLDQGDNDPVRFWEYFIAAVRTLLPSAGDVSSKMLRAPQPFPAESVLTALINDLSDLSRDIFIVLDDYHLIKAEAVHSGVAFLVDHMPPAMHLIIATRTEPDLPLAHFRGRGTLLEIGPDDLRFTLDEAASLLKEDRAPDLSAEHLSALHGRTEGWAVGLKMAALSLRGRPDVEAFVNTFAGSQRYVMDYLVDEVLIGQPTRIHDFLLATSVLERLSAPLCDFLTGRRDSQSMLLKLEQSNLFIIPLDDSRNWYRYHQLFADLLRHQLEVASGTREVKRLHKRAGQWFENAGLPDEAIRHALAAGDWENAMRLIYQQSGARLKRGEWDTLSGWLQQVPETSLRTKPKLYSQYANVLMARDQLEAAEPVLDYLEAHAGSDRSLQGEVALLQTTLARHKGNIARTVEMGKRALELLPEDDLTMRARVSFIMGTVEIDKNVDLDQAKALISEAYDMERREGDYWTAAGAAAHLGYILWLQGRLGEALEMDRQAVDLAMQTPLAAAPQSGLCLLLYERNDLEGAVRSARLALASSRMEGLAGARRRARYCLVLERLARGDTAGAAAEIEEADEAARHPAVSPSYRAVHAASRVIFALRLGDLPAAIEWGNRLSQYSPDITDVWFRHVPARLLIARGEKAAAAGLLEVLYRKASQAGAQSLVIVLRVCQALAATDPTQSIAFLAEALRLAEPEGFVRTFVDEGRLLAPLLRQALDQGITPGYTAGLLKTIEAEQGRGAVPVVAPLLTERELDVLKLLVTGLSNNQIAAKLIVTPGTVKVHVHNLMEKLNARTRTQAAARARELGLI